MHGRGACMAGVMHGGCVCGRGACMVGGCTARGPAWQGACKVAGLGCGRGHAWQERWPLQRTVCILLECILVLKVFTGVITVTVSAKFADKDVSKVTDTLTGKIVVHPLCPSERSNVLLTKTVTLALRETTQL